MLYATDEHQKKVTATPRSKGICPICKANVVSKCGEINIWHWAHQAKIDCDNWHEPETEWHLKWKSLFPKESVEVTRGENNQHRADILTENGVVIELQHSSISSSEIRKREEFYGGKMLWVIDGTEFVN